MPELYQRLFPIERVAGGKATSSLGYNAGVVAPHGTTTRWSYTVPSNTLAQIEMIALESVRDTASAGPAQQFIGVFSGSGQWLPLCYTWGAAVGDTNRLVVTDCGFAASGEILQGRTNDGSVGGSRYYNLAMSYREFAT